MNKEEYISFLKKQKEDYKQIIDDMRDGIVYKSVESSKYSIYNAMLLCAMLIENVASLLDTKSLTTKYVWEFIMFQEFLLLTINISKQERLYCQNENLVEDIKKIENDILKLKNALEFLDETSQEELDKYLSYKMN